MKVVVQRSAVRMWLLAMGGIPLLVIAVDVLTSRRITNWLRELMFTPEDTQIYEPRDVIWAWALLFFSVFLVLWGLKELFMPTKVIEAREDGLADQAPWTVPPSRSHPLGQHRGHRARRDPGRGGCVAFSSRSSWRAAGSCPSTPGGRAGWRGQRTLGLLAQDWSITPARAAEQLGQFAVEAAQRETRPQPERIPDPT